MLKPKEKNIFGKMEFVFGISSLRKLKIVKISKLLNLDASNTYSFLFNKHTCTGIYLKKNTTLYDLIPTCTIIKISVV